MGATTAANRRRSGAWRWPRRILGVWRLVGYVIAVSLACAFLASRVVYADLAEGSLRAGRELDNLGDALANSKPVFINGTSMNVSTALVDEPPAAVLDRFEAMCRTHPEFLARALADIPAALMARAKVQSGRLWRLGVVRKEAGNDGALTCFTDDRGSSFRDLASRLQAFQRSSDLAELGRFRYVYVRRTDRGTHVRAVWTDGEFNLGKMFPADGDAAGIDSTEVPRPPGSRRILSATSGQVPYGLHIYGSPERRESLRRFYDREMAQRGWARASSDDPDTSGYLKQGAMCFVTLTSRENRTLVTTTETARAETPTGVEVHREP